MSGRGAAALLAVAAVLLTGCGAPILANPPVVRPAGPATDAPPTRVADPIPVVLPRDDAAHDRLTEWWYYTGHLRDETGGRWGFELVAFRAERGAFPVTWASHFALTDESGGRFAYGQRTEIGPQVDRTGAAPGFDLLVDGEAAWELAGHDGADRLVASLSPAETAPAGIAGGIAIELHLRESRPPTLHDGDGWVDFGPAGGSYYYSRTRMAALGTLHVDGRDLAVDGLAWFDHQWGDFIAVGGGGWDWFAVNLDDGTDLTVSLVRDADGSSALAYGTLVAADGAVRHLDRDSFRVEITGRWTSPHTGAHYPAGWQIEVPDERLRVRLEPTVPDQELDTRQTTGVVYWEGSQHVAATRAGRPVGGAAYVELTGYGPAGSAPN